MRVRSLVFRIARVGGIAEWQLWDGERMKRTFAVAPLAKGRRLGAIFLPGRLITRRPFRCFSLALLSRSAATICFSSDTSSRKSLNRTSNSARKRPDRSAARAITKRIVPNRAEVNTKMYCRLGFCPVYRYWDLVIENSA